MIRIKKDRRPMIRAAALSFLALLAASCARETDSVPAEPSGAAGAAAAETADAPLPPPPPPPPTRADDFDWPAPGPSVRLSTTLGDVVVELYPDAAPKTVENFLQYVADGHYDRTIFHRVVGGFVVQGGGYSAYFDERPTRAPVLYEGANGLPNLRTTLAMARTADPNSAAAQWYVNLRDNTRLDHADSDLGPRYGYTVFGRVVSGMDVIDRIGATPTGPGGPFPAEVPVDPILVLRADRVETGAAQ